MTGSSGGQFRSYVWDPILLSSQIVAVMCAFYVSLGLWLCGLALLMGKHASFSQVFDYKDLDFTSAGGKVNSLAFVLNSLTVAAAMWFIVQRAKLCLDFTCTTHGFHLILCWLLAAFPRYWSWWGLNLVCIILTSVMSEYLCMRFEMKAIPVSTSSGVS